MSAKGDLGWAQCLSSVPTFSQSQGLVFRLSRCFGQMVLIHGWPWNIIWHGPWSLYQACSLTTLYPYVSAHRQAKDENFFIFSDRLNLVFIPLLRYFDSVMQKDICSCKFGTSRYNMIYSFFMSSYLLHILRGGLVTVTVGFGSEMSFAVNQPKITHSRPVRVKKKNHARIKTTRLPYSYVLAVCRRDAWVSTEFNLNSIADLISFLKYF